MTFENAIEVSELSKAYGNNLVLRDISFTIPFGQITALLGPNGAGKTTTVEILEGYKKRDHGNVRVLGVDPEHTRSPLKEKIGIVLQESSIDPFLSVAEVLSQRRLYFRQSKSVGEVLEIVGLNDKAKSRVKSLSGGQKRRLDFALALVGNPSLIFLDEPTTGFDPEARRETWSTIKRLADAGATILLTTHYLEEASALASDLILIKGGFVIAHGSPSDLQKEFSKGYKVSFHLSETPSSPPDILETFEQKNGTYVTQRDEVEYLLYELTAWANTNDVHLESLDVHLASLEEIYLDLVKEDGSEPKQES